MAISADHRPPQDDALADPILAGLGFAGPARAGPQCPRSCACPGTAPTVDPINTAQQTQNKAHGGPSIRIHVTSHPTGSNHRNRRSPCDGRGAACRRIAMDRVKLKQLEPGLAADWQSTAASAPLPRVEDDCRLPGRLCRADAERLSKIAHIVQ